MSGALAWWRHVLLAGLVGGLLVAPYASAPAGWLPCLVIAAGAAGALGRALLRNSIRDEAAQAPATAATAGWLACLAGLGFLAGLGTGGARLGAIADGALAGPLGAEVSASGYVTAPLRRSFGEVRLPLETEEGKVLVVAREPVSDLAVGAGVRVTGTLVPPEGAFARSQVARAGALLELRARRLEATGAARGGIPGALDRVRGRAERALGEGMDAGEEALARGFVLGQDDGIDPRIREQFTRSGLAHLLAVSGQNVMLLAILAGVVLGAFGAGLRLRLLLTLAAIAIYVPVAGAGPSILRAGVMGAAGIIATLGGRPTDRAYPPLLAAGLTLLLDPRFGADIGWQLSFAAVVGIMLWAPRLRDLGRRRLARRLPEQVAAPLAEGAALSVAATLATAPLLAYHFEELSLASLPANLLVLPAVAPVMWLGMLMGLLGQAGFVPLGALGAIEGTLLDYVALIARLLGSAGWAQASVPLPGTTAVLAAYAALALAVVAVGALARRRGGLAAPRPMAVLAGLAILLALAGPLLDGAERSELPPDGTLRITALDVGQGDAILLQPPRGDPVLVDGGPPGGATVDALRARGIERLAAAFVTHDQLDHSGGLSEVLAAVEVGRLVHARPAPELAAAARAVGTRVSWAAEGSSFDLGRLELDVLWPPRALLAAPAEDPNARSLVLAVRFAGYEALLTGDAEAEQTRLDPGPVDVLKVAHHGSEDAGLDGLLARSAPRVALIGVGSDNPYGHPSAATTATLAERGVCALRTDLDGAASVELGPGGLSAWTASGPPPSERPGCGAASG